MMKKTCPKCGRTSYSAYEEGTWICPHCGADMRNAGAESTAITECFWCEERMMKTNNNMYVCPSCGWRY